VFSSNFDAYAVGVLPVSYATDSWSPQKSPQVIDDDKTLYSRVVQDSDNLFLRGANNHYLLVADTSTANGTPAYGAFNYVLSTAANAFAGSEVGRLSFDFYEPAVKGAQGNGWLLRLGNGWAGNPSTVFALTVGQGKILQVIQAYNKPEFSLATYEPAKPHTLVIVFNASAAAIVYDGITLPSGTMDVWLDDKHVGKGIPGSGGKGHDWTGAAPQVITNFNFTRSQASADPAQDFVGKLFIDDVSLLNVAAAPKPGAQK
jgi:hypothetical protein